MARISRPLPTETFTCTLGWRSAKHAFNALLLVACSDAGASSHDCCSTRLAERAGASHSAAALVAADSWEKGMTKPRALIIGGSVGGLFAAHLLDSIDWDVDV